MSKNLFDLVSEDFYKPLCSKHKRIYTDCIQLIYEIAKEGFIYGMKREYIVNEIERYIEDYNIEINIGEDDDLQASKNPREQANKMVLYFKKCGWLTYETSNSHEVLVLVNEYALAQMDVMNRYINEDDIEYEGLISQMYATVVNERFYRQPYQLVIKPLRDNIERLLTELKRLGASMKSDMEEELKGKTDLEAMNHFCEYRGSATWKSYQRLKTSDNMYFYKNNITAKLRQIDEDIEIMKLAEEAFMMIEGEKDQDQANDKIKGIIWEIIEGVNQLEDVMYELDHRYTSYIKTITLRAQFLMKMGNNLEGKITQILQGVRESAQRGNVLLEESILNTISSNVNLYPQYYLTGESLQAPRGKKVDKVVDELNSSTIFTLEDQERMLAEIKQRSEAQIDIKTINRDIDKILGSKKEVHVNELVLSDKKDLIWIVYALIYQDKSSATYSIRETGGRIVRNGYSVPEFYIYKKGKV